MITTNNMELAWLLAFCLFVLSSFLPFLFRFFFSVSFSFTFLFLLSFLLITIFVAPLLTMNFLRNSKLGVWPPDLPDLVNLNYAIMSLFKYPITHKRRQMNTCHMGKACIHAHIHTHAYTHMLYMKMQLDQQRDQQCHHPGDQLPVQLYIRVYMHTNSVLR